MREDRRLSGVTVELPDAYESVSQPGARGRRRAADATTEIPNFEEVDGAFLRALLEEDMELVDEFEYVVDRRRARSARGRSTDEQSMSVALTAQPGETAVALIEQDGVYSWQFPVVGPPTDRRGARLSDQAEVIRFEIPLSDAAPGAATRSVFSAVADLADRVKGKILKTATDRVLSLLEAKVDHGLVLMDPGGPERWSRIQDPTQLELPTDSESRILLFVHGTFSSTVGSFHSLASLADDQLFADLWDKYDCVLGFDHATLSVDPEQNALELLHLLEGLGSKGLVFDAVSYSRGGLVLRSLVESLLPSADFQGRLERAVFVGATNEGTALAEPDNWRDFVDVYTNLALGAARVASLLPNAAPVATVVSGAVQGVAVFVKFLVDHVIDERAVPGLAAMNPGGQFVQRINETQTGQPGPDDVRYYAVTSDFEGGASSGGLANELPKKFLIRAADPVVDRLLKNEPNDLVVNTASMTAIDRAAGFPTAEALEFGQNSVVYHTVYFTQEALAESLRAWLNLTSRSSTRRAGAPQPSNPLTQVPAAIVTAEEMTAAPPPTPPTVRAQARPALEIEVVWDDIRDAPGDIYAVGHYIGVMPQRAEWALDTVVSDSTAEEDLVLSRLTRSNALRGDLGEISFFPWGGSNKRNRLIAVCGMGHYGPFGGSQLRRLHYNLAQSIMALPDPRTLCTVLIGAGEGALRTDVACTQLLFGFADAMRATQGGDRIRRVRIVELFKTKAEEIHAALDQLSKDGRAPLDLHLAPKIVVGGRGRVSDQMARTLLVRAASRAGVGSNGPITFEDVERSLPEDIRDVVSPSDGDVGEAEESPLRSQLRTTWEEAEGDVESLISVASEPPIGPDEPQRIAFLREVDVYRVSAITDNATVPERTIRVSPRLIEEAVSRMTDPLPADLPEFSELLFRLTLPRDFRELMAAMAPLVFEVDRSTAEIHWEALASGAGGPTYDPIGLIRPIARQLRTQYSEAVTLGGGQKGRPINVLVIGDPGDPNEGLNLRHARLEARDIAKHLSDLAGKGANIEVQLLIGAPNNTERGVPPATRLEVVRRLLKGDVDLVHYSGHGDFDRNDPSRSGWLFHDGLLTAGEIERVDTPPAIVFANACLTGRFSSVTASGVAQSGNEAGLVASLADEFLNRGVRNYIGTAWEIDDQGAVQFARVFYEEFLGDGAGNHPTIGDALLKARQELKRWESEQAQDLVLWAAYQHYGDPGFRSAHI